MFKKIKVAEIDPHNCSQLNFDKEEKAVQWSKDSLFNKWCCNNQTCTYLGLTLFTNINSKLSECKTINLEENIGENPDDLGYGNAFLGITPMIWLNMKGFIVMLDFLKIKSCSMKAVLREWGDQPQTGRKYLYKTYLIKDYCSKHNRIESACNVGDLSSMPRLGRSPGEGNSLPTPVFRPGEFHGLYGLWGCKESDTNEQLSLPLFIQNIYGCFFFSGPQNKEWTNRLL